MNCQRCESSRVLTLDGKCGDRCQFRYRDQEGIGYVPFGVEAIGGGGDYISVKICLECGQTQGEFPQPEPEID